MKEGVREGGKVREEVVVRIKKRNRGREKGESDLGLEI